MNKTRIMKRKSFRFTLLAIGDAGSNDIYNKNMKRKLIITIVLAVLTMTAAEARKFS